MDVEDPPDAAVLALAGWWEDRSVERCGNERTVIVVNLVTFTLEGT